MENPLKYFAELHDPRVERNREHLLEEILLIWMAAVLSGAESWTKTCRVTERQAGVVEDVSDASMGIPSHDTFNRVFAAGCQLRKEMEKVSSAGFRRSPS